MPRYANLLAASGIALSMSVVGCTPSANMRPSTLSAAAPKAERNSAKLADQARAAAQAGKSAQALELAERAVEASPRDVGYRMLLGDLYLKAGRFTAAETAFADVTTLDPGNVRGTLSLALSMIAQGKTVLATTELDKLDGSGLAGDLGLAYALAGEHGRAQALLEAAASGPGATGRVRQNLALAYALAGEWRKARTIAAQDVSPAELDSRLTHWASLASPANSYTQVASLLGVTPVEDAGQPLRLALAAEASAPVYAEVAPAPEPVATVPPAPVIVAAAPAPVVTAPVVASAPAPVVTAPVVSAAPVELAAAVRSLVEPRPTVIKASAPIPAFRPARIASLEPRSRKRAAGRYVVQIGAYRNLGQAERAWDMAASRYGIGADKQPLSTTVTLPGRGTFHRLSVAPFQAPAEATRVCHTIRARGGACFVRTLAGDAPLQYAMRAARRG